ncbi:MAG TPA: ABC transporter permease [Methanophagales archaeon]|nr:ABC transporter permease [Methanophagales archaeon]
MEAKRLFNVAQKEFIDHITSRKFILILALFLLISAYSMHEGIGDYNNRLEDYKEQLSQVEEGELRYMHSEKPSILFIFQRMTMPMTILGAILAITMGFDLITREKESHSLKSLLSHPVYRDEIINGKALGGFLVLVFAIGIAFLISFAILLLFSMVPNMDDFARVTLFWAVTVLFILTYFSIALMTSTVSKDSGRSLMYALIITLVLSVGVPAVGEILSESVVGEPPEPPAVPQYEEWQRYEEESRAYYGKQEAIKDVVNTFAPWYNYLAVSFVVLYGTTCEIVGPGVVDATPGRDVLEKVWKNIFVLIILPIVFFAIAYIKFMRMDIR